jgi:hypothetical protein
MSAGARPFGLRALAPSLLALQWFRNDEDYWAIWLGLLIIAVAVTAFWLDSPWITRVAATPASWSTPAGSGRT